MNQQQDPGAIEAERREEEARQTGDTTGAASMTGGDRSAIPLARPDASGASPAGRSNPTGGDQGSVGHASVGGSPTGPGGGDMPTGSGGQGSLGTGTYNDRGNLTGPDSPAGPQAAGSAPGEGQGDDLVNRVGGERTGAGLSGAGAATGDASAGRSEPAESAEPIAPDAGSPGGMGGVHAQGGTGTDRPAGGVSPVQDRDRGRG